MARICGVETEQGHGSARHGSAGEHGQGAAVATHSAGSGNVAGHGGGGARRGQQRRGRARRWWRMARAAVARQGSAVRLRVVEARAAAREKMRNRDTRAEIYSGPIE